jgi:hypothetical protein
MQKITKEYNVYTFDELSKEVQEKLIEKEREHQVEDYCEISLKDDMEQKAIELLQENYTNVNGECFATLKNVLYDLSYCQGSGAMIEYDINDEEREQVINVTHNNSCHYYHENSFTINYDNLTDEQYKLLKDKVYNINCELTKYGYASIDSSNFTDEYLISILQENDYLIDGEVFYE